MIEHQTIRVGDAALHVATAGQGKPLLLLHGWPEFWLTWEPVMQRLADRYRLIAPDLRGFGDSDKPPGLFGADAHAADMLGVLDALGIEQAGIVGHDVGGAVMQPLACRRTDGAICACCNRWMGSMPRCTYACNIACTKATGVSARATDGAARAGRVGGESVAAGMGDIVAAFATVQAPTRSGNGLCSSHLARC